MTTMSSPRQTTGEAHEMQRAMLLRGTMPPHLVGCLTVGYWLETVEESLREEIMEDAGVGTLATMITRAVEHAKGEEI